MLLRRSLVLCGLVLGLLAPGGCGKGDRAGGPSLSEQYQQALLIDNPESRAIALTTVAEQQMAAGDQRNAELSIEKALEACAAITDASGRAGSLTRLAQAQADMGQSAAAKRTLKQVRTAAAQVEDPESRAKIYSKIAVVYGKHLDNPDLAANYIGQATSQVEQLDDAVAQGTALTRIASDLTEMDAAEQVEGVLETALETAATIDDARQRSNLVAEVAAVLNKIGQQDRATELFNQAIASARAVAEPVSKAHALADIARSLVEAAQRELAGQLLAEAEQVSEQVKDEGLRNEVQVKINERRRRL